MLPRLAAVSNGTIRHAVATEGFNMSSAHPCSEALPGCVVTPHWRSLGDTTSILRRAVGCLALMLGFAASAAAAEFGNRGGPVPARVDEVLSVLRQDSYEMELLISYGTSKGARRDTLPWPFATRPRSTTRSIRPTSMPTAARSTVRVSISPN